MVLTGAVYNLCVFIIICVCVCVFVSWRAKGCEWTPKSHYWSALPPRHTLGSRAVKWPLWWFTLNPLTLLPHYPLLFFYSSTVSPLLPSTLSFHSQFMLQPSKYCCILFSGYPWFTVITRLFMVNPSQNENAKTSPTQVQTFYHDHLNTYPLTGCYQARKAIM